tara:strand:- start:219 stop:527 length:309 start_codon:yes stop_codon:yes gene_type:complete
MPYKSTDAAIESSEYYGVYRQKELERKRQNILKQRTDYKSNPKFSQQLTRDSRGFIVSFEDPLAFGKAQEEQGYELVTIELKSRNFIKRYETKIDSEFKDLI